ncbi:MAG TPA: beta-L-arabinofuranosidase domain-containing protein [Bacteroidota bacterium]|nr:beta-L-arabinofuranosidase domain-containing protein [Bacteroidota bacterium]
MQSFQKLCASGQSGLYPGNRPPLRPNALSRLPLGSVRPRLWLRNQLEYMRDGFSGHLSEISKWCVFDGSAWVNPSGRGNFGWEEVPYWLRGYIDLAYLLDDPRMKAEASRWVEGVLTTQDSSGYFGPRANGEAPDLWPNMVMLYVLRSDFEATADKRVLPLMIRYTEYLSHVPHARYLPDSWQNWRGGDNLDHIYWLYNRTGEPRLLELAKINHERTADWTTGIPTWHGVNICQGFREPAEYFQQTLDETDLHATERNYDSVMSIYGQVPGGMFAADEDARPGHTGPRQAAETCSMAEFMHSDEMLVAITGDPRWADRCEEVAFNSLPASMTPDLRGLHYLTAPNMIQLDTASKEPMLENGGNMLSYDPWEFRCCQHNVAFAWPYFVESLWMATQDSGLAAVMYSPCAVSANVGHGEQVTINEMTEYPFAEDIEFTIHVAKPVRFPLTFRIPNWCASARVQVNGKDPGSRLAASSWLRLCARWNDGDVIRVTFPSKIAIHEWKKNGRALSVQRGPLSYSLKIGERWSRIGGTDRWPAFEVYPTTPWNYGLEVDPAKAESGFEVVRKSDLHPPQPFALDQSPIEIRARGRRIPGWKQESNGLIGEFRDGPVRSEEPLETITLIPMGCARLRISMFPRVSNLPDAIPGQN